MKIQIKGWQLLTALHATVDGLCACCLFSLLPDLSAMETLQVFAIYNYLAFLTQPITGFWIDKMRSRQPAFILSVSLLLLGGILCIVQHTFNLHFSPYIFVISIGLGNSLFHVFGGKYVTNYSHNDMRYLGIFVSTGALGIFLGQSLYSLVALSVVMISMLLLSLLFLKVKEVHIPVCSGYKEVASSKTLNVEYSIPLFLFILLIVAFRSFLGNMIPFSSREIAYFSFFACVLAVFGKAFGGYVARFFGTGTTLYVTLLLSGLCFLLDYYHVGFILAMIMFINLSMPITLHLANRCFPQYEGFAFGMLAAFLIPGDALAHISNEELFVYHLLYPLISTILIEALVLLALNERRWKVLCSSVVINILTNFPLNLYVNSLHRPITQQDVLLLESGVVLIESLIYFLITKDIRKALLYGILCNVISYFIGYVYLSLF